MVRFEHLLGLIDPLGDQDGAWTRLGALEIVLAGSGSVRIIKNRQPFPKTMITGVGQESVCLTDGGRSEKPDILREDRTGGITGRAEDAISGIVEEQTILLGLDAFFFGNRLVIDQKRFHRAILPEKFRLIHNQIPLHRQMP